MTIIYIFISVRISDLIRKAFSEKEMSMVGDVYTNGLLLFVSPNVPENYLQDCEVWGSHGWDTMQSGKQAVSCLSFYSYGGVTPGL
jgi:hypothetical protein